MFEGSIAIVITGFCWQSISFCHWCGTWCWSFFCYSFSKVLVLSIESSYLLVVNFSRKRLSVHVNSALVTNLKCFGSVKWMPIVGYPHCSYKKIMSRRKNSGKEYWSRWYQWIRDIHSSCPYCHDSLTFYSSDMVLHYIRWRYCFSALLITCYELYAWSLSHWQPLFTVSGLVASTLFVLSQNADHYRLVLSSLMTGLLFQLIFRQLADMQIRFRYVSDIFHDLQVSFSLLISHHSRSEIQNMLSRTQWFKVIWLRVVSNFQIACILIFTIDSLEGYNLTPIRPF